MREHASEGNEAARDAESPDHLQSGLTEALGTPGRSLSIAQVALLQRTAGNAAVARALHGHRGPVTRALIQRQIKTTPENLKDLMKPSVGVDILDRIRTQLKAYHGTPAGDPVRLALAKGMLTNIGDWLLAYRDPKIAASGKASIAKHGVDTFRGEIEGAYPQLGFVVPEHEYVADMRARRLQWVSKESGAHATSDKGGEVVAAEKLAKGEAKKHGASTGTGQEALALVRAYDLTEAEIMAIKVYSVGDYRTINPTLAANEAWLKKSLPYIRGAPDRYKGGWLEPPGPKPPDPKQHATWQADKDKFDVVGALWAAGLAPDDLSNVRAEARRHAQHAETGLEKLPKSTDKTYRGEQLTDAEFKAMYPSKGHIRTEKYFLSTSKNETKADMYASGAPKGKVGVMLECQLTGKKGRDIELISVHRVEEEVLLLPDARLQITYVGAPPPGKTYDKLVQLTEV